MALAACQGGMPDDAFSGVIDPLETEVTRGSGPPDADPNACYARETTPAVVETVTEQVMLQPPQTTDNGGVLAPPIFVTDTQYSIVEERRDLWFETPCQAESDPEFIASIQRALTARGLYDGAPTGVMDARTRAAIRAFQAPQGLNSPILSLGAAQQLGIALWNPELAAGGADGG